MPVPGKLDLTFQMDLRTQDDVIQLDGGTGDYIIINPFTKGLPWDSMSVEFWVRTNDLGNAGTMFHYAATGTIKSFLVQDQRDIELTMSGDTTEISGVSINDGVPHHIAVAWFEDPPGIVNLYVDGKLRFSAAHGPGSLTDGGAITIGQEQSTVGGGFVAGSEFIGEIWDVRVWTSLRNSTQVFDNMNLRLASAATPFMYWKIDEGTGTLINDFSTNGNDGTLNGSTWVKTETRFWTDVTAFVQPETVFIESALGNLVDSARFTLEQFTGVRPTEWDEVVVFDGSTRVFGGFIRDVNSLEVSDLLLNFEINASDYGLYLDKAVVNKEYEDQDDDEIIQDFMQLLVPFIGSVDHVAQIKSHSIVRFNRRTVREALDSLVEFAQADWYISYDRELYYFDTSDITAPFNLSDTPDFAATHPYDNLQKDVDGVGVVNRVTVVGGTFLSDDQVFIMQGTGKDERLLLPFKPHAPEAATEVKVERNQGGVGDNNIVNPRFEVNVTDGWTFTQGGTGGTVVRDTGTKHTGAASAKITAGTGVCTLESGTIAVAEEVSVTVQCRVSTTAGTIGSMKLRIWDTTSGAERAVLNNRIQDGTFEWLTATWLNTTGASANVRVELENAESDSAAEAFFDAVMMELLSWPSDYIDGSLGAGYTWSGTTDNSTSDRDSTVGAIYVVLDTKVGYIDQNKTREDVLLFFQEKVLETETFWPELFDACRMTAKVDIPLRTRIRDQASFNFYGRFFDEILVDNDIVDKATAELAARALISKFGLGQAAVTCETREPGLRSGMKITLDNGIQSISEEFLIQRVGCTVGIFGYTQYTIEMGLFNPDFIDLILRLNRASKPKALFRVGEKLDDFLKTEETLDFAEVVTVDSEDDYRWGPYTPPPGREMVWDFFSWA